MRINRRPKRLHRRPSTEQEQEQEPQYAPPPSNSADEIEHLSQLHDSGALTDDEFAAAKAKILGA